jgi:hypothetical protein
VVVDVVRFFSEHFFQDSQAEAGNVHPILQVDAIQLKRSEMNSCSRMGERPGMAVIFQGYFCNMV